MKTREVKASELIVSLGKIIAQYGDLPVRISDGNPGTMNISGFTAVKKEPYYLGCGDGFEVPTQIILLADNKRIL